MESTGYRKVCSHGVLPWCALRQLFGSSPAPEDEEDPPPPGGTASSLCINEGSKM